MEREISHCEICDWLRAFIACRVTAFCMIPNDCYAYLRKKGLLDAEHDVTHEGQLALEYGV